MTDSQTKLKSLLRELFQLDKADLDFGIYRIMNTKRMEIERFLDNDLLPRVKQAFDQYQSSDSVQLKLDLDKLIQQLKDAGVDPEVAPKVKELRAKLASAVDVAGLEHQVFSDLFNFFRRYYHEGDFLSLRRYKEGIYAIPYEGEEVKLYWANYDQYYIKSGEQLQRYSFKAGNGMQVYFRLVQADTEKDNNKATNGSDRRFILADSGVSETNQGLELRFEYRVDDQKRKQDVLNTQTVSDVLKASISPSWLSALATTSPTASDPGRTVLAKHLADYTARNSFDYFIHKNAGAFLRRELDLFIKNEVMNLDDIELSSVPKVEQYLSRVRVLRSIAHKLIAFVAQLEDFQKKLWLKKKFITETQFSVTLDRVPVALYGEIAANDAQRTEWVQLLGIDAISKDLHQPGYSVPLSVDFLKAFPSLPIDTRHFPVEFRTQLLSSFDDIDTSLTGWVVQSDNAQALRLLGTRFGRAVNCVFIDPPYNTGQNDFIYKDNYRGSSWLAMMADRLTCATRVLSPSGAIGITIDDNEVARLKLLMNEIFGADQFQAQIAWEKRYTRSNNTNDFTSVIDHLLFYGASPDYRVALLPRDETADARYENPDKDARGPWKSIPFTNPRSARERPNLAYTVTNPNTGKTRTPQGDEKAWRSSQMVFETHVAEKRVWWGLDGKSDVPSIKRFLSEVRAGMTPINLWSHEFAGHTDAAKAEIKDLFGFPAFDNPKPTLLVKRFVQIAVGDTNEPLIADFFAGSGTTGQAVLELADERRARFLLVESGDHFDTLILPRLKKCMFSTEWSAGIPTVGKGRSAMFKYLRVESYEDTLNNLSLSRSEMQDDLLQASSSLRDQYVLSYMLDVETKHSSSLLNVDRFSDPFSYCLDVSWGSANAAEPTKIDLVETFNMLLGLHVRHLDVIRGFTVVSGRSPEGDRVLVIWRNVADNPSDSLDSFFERQGYNTKDMEYDIVYVNGDNNLENLKKDEDTWKVRLIEEEFRRLMFDVEG